ncbi:MAG: hypothetical protein ACKVHR_13950 [Pirellulales bacterium]|jgi:hypothetical protein
MRLSEPFKRPSERVGYLALIAVVALLRMLKLLRVDAVLPALFVCIMFSVFPASLQADIPPQSLEQLNAAEIIVVGTIKRIRIETERSSIETAFGNYDWGIYLTLSIIRVEKGELKGPEVVLRCFRTKSRRSVVEGISIRGHDPIPGVGTKVRVYLNKESKKWTPVIPNGFTAPTADDDSSVGFDHGFLEAAELVELRAPVFTFIIPIELWGMLLVTAPIAFLVFRKLKRLRS